jgi:hypothetical protein
MPKTIKRGLMIGINYIGQNNELNGCINDSKNLTNFMIKKKFFKQNELVSMNDKKKGSLNPTKTNIIRQFDFMVRLANKNKKTKILFFLSYSGHGYYLSDKSKDECDGKDEVLCPVDYLSKGYITDDLIKNRFINKLPSNVKLVTLIDACHSGTICDLKFDYKVDNMLNYNVCGGLKQSQCNVIMISGCKDDQYSTDAYLNNQFQGAMTSAFINNYRKNITYQQLIIRMRRWLSIKKFDQIPQLSSGRMINIKKPFLLEYFD